MHEVKYILSYEEVEVGEMKEKKIKQITNNMEKYINYRELKGRQSAAIENGFYFEALLIDYALIEDRMQSYLYHLGILEDRLVLEMSEIANRYIRPIILEYKRNEEKARVDLKKLEDKMKIVRCILKWVNESDRITDVDYLITIKRQCESMDIGLMYDLLERLGEWKGYRNEVIHGLMNKNIDSLNLNLKFNAIEGRNIADDLDTQLKIMKGKDEIRKAAGMKC